MISNQVTILPEKGKDIVFRKGPSLQEGIPVLSYKMHTHKSSVRLLLSHRDGAYSRTVCFAYSIDKQRDDETSLDKDELLEGISSFKMLSNSAFYKHVPLPHRVAVSQRKEVDIKRHTENKSLHDISYPISPALCRERIRKERCMLLKRCPSPIKRDDKRFHATRVPDHVLVNASEGGKTRLERGLVSRKTSCICGESKSIWKGFINALMRDGNKLRYQSVLRKALLTGVA